MNSDNFSVVKSEDAIWYGPSYWNGTHTFYTITNISDKVQDIQAIIATLLPCNSGGLQIYITGDNPYWFGPTPGNGGQMICEIVDSNGTVYTSETTQIKSINTSNLVGDNTHNWRCWFEPRPGPEYKFNFSTNISLDPNEPAEVKFKMTWDKADAYNTIQISSADFLVVAERDNVTLTIEPQPESGFNSISEGGQYPPGTEVELSAKLNDGYQFIGWVLQDSVLSTSLNYTYTVPEYDVTIKAIAQQNLDYIWVYRKPDSQSTGKWVKEKIAYRYNKQGGWKPI